MNFVRDIWDILSSIVGYFQFCTFIDEWDEGVLLRRGKFVRTVAKGIVWHLPFDIDEIHTMNVRPTAMELDEQSLLTADDQRIVISVVLMWSIFDIKKCMLDVEDASDTLGDIAVGYVAELVEEWDFADIRTHDFRKELKKRIQKQARKFGISVPTVKVSDLIAVRAYKLF